MASEVQVMPGEGLDIARMPGHWLLARLGKRVLRPGGIEMTRDMLAGLAIGQDDDVVELAPGLGVTAALVLDRRPKTYTGIDRDEAAVAHVRSRLKGAGQQVCLGQADATGLEDGVASVVLGEAMLTMQSANHKRDIVREALRCLRSGGRYGIHEMALIPDDIGAELKKDIESDLAQAIRVGARPLTASEWRALLTDEGFVVEQVREAPMYLLELGRFVQDEGLIGTARFVYNLVSDRRALTRVQGMRKVFRQYAKQLGAISIVARKP